MNNKMEANYKISLSSSEIIILASMMGAESIIGIHRSDSVGRLKNADAYIEAALRSLEEKRLVSFSFDGTLHIMRPIAELVRTMISPEKAAVISYLPKGGSKKCFYILKRGEHTVRCERQGTGMYVLCALGELVPEMLFSSELFKLQIPPFSLTLPFEDAENAKGCIEGFDTEAAASILSGGRAEPLPVEALCEALSGNCGVLNVKVRIKRGTLYTTVYRNLLAVTSTGVLLLSDDGAENITFTAAEPCEMTESIIKIFNS